MVRATRFAFLVDTPLATISDTAAMTARPARLVGLGVHDLVDGRLGHRPYELGHVHHAVVESRHQGTVARDLVYLVHMRLLPFRES